MVTRKEKMTVEINLRSMLIILLSLVALSGLICLIAYGAIANSTTATYTSYESAGKLLLAGIAMFPSGFLSLVVALLTRD